MNYRTKSVYCIILILSFSSFRIYGQVKSIPPLNLPKSLKIFQDTAKKNKNIVVTEPDSNFTYQKYAAFLKNISDTGRYIVLPLNEFRQTFNSDKIIIGLRHDVDIDLGHAWEFSAIESAMGFRSTYFILHTAPYYLANENNMEVHNDKIIPLLKKMQNERHFEIGWHNDLVTLQVVYNINPVTYLHNELKWLRANGLKIYGTAAHGSSYCKQYHYMNFYFFEECSYPILPHRENNNSVPVNGKFIKIRKSNLSEFKFLYEAYFLNNNKAYSDATITDGVRWNPGMIDLNQLHKGDRVIILTHPTHWHKESDRNNIEKFSIPGQLSCTIDSINGIIKVVMPAGKDRSSLVPEFQLSPGAMARVSGKRQITGWSLNNFNEPVVYTVFAENREIIKKWTIDVYSQKTLAEVNLFALPALILRDSCKHKYSDFLYPFLII